MATVDGRDLEHWERHGYVIVEGLLSPAELAAVGDNIGRYLPSWEEYSARPARYQALLSSGRIRGQVGAAFPYLGDALNDVVLHPYLLAFAEAVLGTDDLALSQAGLMAKYAGMGDFDQDLHLDYGNNTLAYPKAAGASSILPVIVYYTDVTVEGGPTYVVSQEHTRRELLVPRHRSRREYPELYEHEAPVTVRAGSAFIYSMRTFHRGSAMTATEGVRFTHHLTYQPAGPRWVGMSSFQGRGGSPEMDHFLVRATPRQRQIVGFPAICDPYWDEETLAGVGARYPDMDLRPYREAAAP